MKTCKFAFKISIDWPKFKLCRKVIKKWFSKQRALNRCLNRYVCSIKQLTKKYASRHQTTKGFCSNININGSVFKSNYKPNIRVYFIYYGELKSKL